MGIVIKIGQGAKPRIAVTYQVRRLPGNIAGEEETHRY
ncbi:MAG: hypothetical protein ACP5GZ_06375 [Vulcanisaeta sp.]